ncbi:MAG: hypothetical protein NTX59_12320 [Elusimicrobia bacterium]|nr:hypothetical protein [Elusimicrobiota bacterium]
MKKNLAIAFRSYSLKEIFVAKLFFSYNYWLSGFRTIEKREAGSRLGFTLETARGQRFELASKNLFGPARLNKYGVNLPGLETAFKEAFESAAKDKKILFLDELGPMTLLSPAVRRMAAEALVSSVPCLVFFRRGAKSFEGTLSGLDNTAVADLNPDAVRLRQQTESWFEECIRGLKEL